MLTENDLLKGQVCPPEYEVNLQLLLSALNTFLSLYGKSMIVTSGYRSPDHNAQIGGKPLSAHTVCMAADFHDPDHSLKDFILSNPTALETSSLYCEDWRYYQDPNDTHIHLQTRPVASGHRIFIP